MDYDTAFTRLMGCAIPLQVAGMGSIVTPPLAAAVAREGGVGTFGVQGMPAAALAAMLDGLPRDVPGAYAVTFLMPFFDAECVPVAAERIRSVEFYYAAPDAGLVAQAHEHGALAAWQVGSVADAQLAEAAGCDYVIVQGIEAGGRLRGEGPMLELVGEAVSKLTVPVVAAGGIGTGAQMAEALKAGATAVRLGTRFAVADESGAHPEYIERLIAAEADDTVVTEKFSVLWPQAGRARVLQSSVDAAEAAGEEIVAKTETPGGTLEIPRWSIFPPLATTTGNTAAMPNYAGRSVSSVTRRQPAAEIVRELMQECSGGPGPAEAGE